MSETNALLAIDQGTTSSRAIVFAADDGRILAQAQEEFPQLYPRSGWVEHDPEAIWQSVLRTTRTALKRAEAAGLTVVAAGITNQRETVLIWDRNTGKPIHNAIVWQDRRTADHCRALRNAGHEAMIGARTGLLLDPYFSASKIAWLLDHVDGARARAEAGALAFGTVDSFLLWRLSGGRVHATDATNAARTLLFDIHRQVWDDTLLRLFGIPRALLPEVRDSAADYGETDPALLGRAVPIRGVAGDQQAASVGQGCFQPGSIKSTYGTGSFVVLNTGETPVASENRLLTTIAYRLDGRPTYALEGAIFAAGAAVQWLRDSLGLMRSAAETEALAESLPDNRGVYLVPAFTGLGAPHWRSDARGALFGLTRDSGAPEFARAALESVCYQTHDLLRAMAQDGARLATLRVDGGMVANNWLCQFLADILAMPVERPRVMETTALGAALLAGLGCGLYDGVDSLIERWACDARFAPAMEAGARATALAGWQDALSRVLVEGAG